LDNRIENIFRVGGLWVDFKNCFFFAKKMKEDEVLVLQKGFGGWIEREKKNPARVARKVIVITL